MKAKDIMTVKVITISAAAKIYELTQLLVENKISGVPVCDDDGQLVGMVTNSDLIALKKGERVRDIMTPNIISVGADFTIEEVAAVLNNNKIKRVPVFEDKRMVGIISRGDLIRALAVDQKDDRG